MNLEQDYRVLARFLVQTHGASALDYARRYMEESAEHDEEAERMWQHVSRAVEQVITTSARRRIGDCAPS